VHGYGQTEVYLTPLPQQNAMCCVLMFTFKLMKKIQVT